MKTRNFIESVSIPFLVYVFQILNAIEVLFLSLSLQLKKKSVLKLFQLSTLGCDRDSRRTSPAWAGGWCCLSGHAVGQDAQAGPHVLLEGLTLVPAPGERGCHTSRLPPMRPHCRQGQRDTKVPKMIIILFFSLGLARVARK